MDYIDKLNNGHPISEVFTSSRETSYRHLFIVSAREKEALLYFSDEKKLFLSEWYDHIDDFDNFIYTKVYLGDNYNYIYQTGNLVSPYWSDEMSKLGQILWPISFNGKYNFIKEGGSLLLNEFANGLWIDAVCHNRFVIRQSSTYSCYNSVDNYGKIHYLRRDTKYARCQLPVADIYSSKSNLTEGLILRHRLLSLSIEDASGKCLISNVLGITKYNVKPIGDIEEISVGKQGVLFTVREEELSGNKILLLFYDFATIHCIDGYRILSFSNNSLLPDTFEEVQTLRSLFVKVRKDGVWNIIDKYGNYVSKELWFDSIELMSNGNAVVKKGQLYNFLKSNGSLLFPEWFDEIMPASEDGKFVICRGDKYNVIDNNLHLENQEWNDDEVVLPVAFDKVFNPFDLFIINGSVIHAYDSVWVEYHGYIVECCVLSSAECKLTFLWFNDEIMKVDAIVVELRYHNDYSSSVDTPIGMLYFNMPK